MGTLLRLMWVGGCIPGLIIEVCVLILRDKSDTRCICYCHLSVCSMLLSGRIIPRLPEIISPDIDSVPVLDVYFISSNLVISLGTTSFIRSRGIMIDLTTRF